MSRIKTCLPFVLLLLFKTEAFAQNPDIKRTWHWYFGHQCGLDFSSGSPVVDTNSALNTFEGCSVMSDTAGNLLFYTDGDTVWNRFHQPMPNGSGLLGCGNYGSSSQAGLIVPYPAHDSLFYIFTTDCEENSFASGLTYSIVNINLDNGNGDVYIKNQLLLQNGTEGIAVTKHANGVDYWLLTHEFGNINYLAYLITAFGINPPIVQPLGAIVPQDHISYLKFSGDGSLFVGSLGNLFHFNDTTGILSDLINLLNSYIPEFSPDNSKLYTWAGGNVIVQYCLTNYDSISINSSYFELDFSGMPGVDNNTFGVMQKGPDGKIYIASIVGQHDTISVINNPNKYGYGCDVSIYSVYPGGHSWGGLPNFVRDYLDFNQVASGCDSTVGFDENYSDHILLTPNPASEYLNIKFLSANEKKHLFIYEYTGELIFHSESTNDLVKIDISQYPESFYIIKVQTTNKTIAKKFIINH